MEPPAKMIKWNGYDEIAFAVPIVAGQEEIEVAIQKSLPCAESKFLEAEFEKNVEPGVTNKVVIAEHSSMAVLIFANWLWTAKVETVEEYTDIRSGSQETQDVITGTKAQWSALADCFRLGEYLVAGRFKNDVMDALVSKSKEIHELGGAAGLNSDQLNAIYDGTNESSPLRRLVLHNFLVSDVENIIDELDDSLARVREFLKDVAKYTLSKLRHSSSNDSSASSEEPWSWSSCEYHEHVDQGEGFYCTKR
ncbi:hypothetical protein IFR04_012548 [Cadophora malorum]|uniref:BTB domain-containing protein n=1 Tax=Cadophora malorum TaxID=108018 RepID=A0A8H7T886_9HELO|nr:hypothetical protein IFR04_012548 [Cadophora malorum]